MFSSQFKLEPRAAALALQASIDASSVQSDAERQYAPGPGSVPPGLLISDVSPDNRRLLLGWWERRGGELFLLILPQSVHFVETGDQAEEVLNAFARPRAGDGKLSYLRIDDPVDEPS